MKPKLIILNGAPGVGKSTMAQRYAGQHPLTLQLDVDVIRRFISSYREEYIKSGMLSKNLALVMARTHLISGYDVVIAQCYKKLEDLEALETLAADCGVSFHEFLLSLPKEETLSRFIKRGQAEGAPDGFRSGGLITIGGGIKKLESMYDEIMETAAKRPNAIVIEPILGDVEGTYRELMKYLE